VRLSLLFSSSLSAIGGGHGWERWPGMVQLASGWVVFELGRDWGKSWTSLPFQFCVKPHYVQRRLANAQSNIESPRQVEA